MFKTIEINEAVKGSLINGKNTQINNFSIDSRSIHIKDFFIPIVGTNDGHNYILDAVGRGAIGFFISDKYKNKDEIIKKAIELNNDIIIILVDNTLDSLHDLAKYNRTKHVNTKFIGITGSNGKTSTKEILYNIINLKYNVLKTEGNYNNHLGLPLTLLKLSNHDVCILEMGMNHRGEIDILTKIAEPNIAIITNIGTAHIGNLGSQDEIYNAKSEILNGLKDDGILIINGDDNYLNKLKYKNTIKIGLNRNNDIVASNIAYKKDSSSFYVPLLKTTFETQNIGKSNIYNSLFGIAVANILNINTNQIKNGLNKKIEASMRMQINYLENNIMIINDTYNANFESLDNGLDYVDTLTYSNKIIVLGDILETGEYSYGIHKMIAEKLNTLKFNYVLTFGQLTKVTYDRLNTENKKHFIDKSNLIKYINNLNLSDLVIYLKGSRGMKLEEIITHIG